MSFHASHASAACLIHQSLPHNGAKMGDGFLSRVHLYCQAQYSGVLRAVDQGPHESVYLRKTGQQQEVIVTLMRFETPAVAKNSSSLSNAAEQTMSPSPMRSPYFNVAFTCSHAKKSSLKQLSCCKVIQLDTRPCLCMCDTEALPNSLGLAKILPESLTLVRHTCVMQHQEPNNVLTMKYQACSPRAWTAWPAWTGLSRSL